MGQEIPDLISATIHGVHQSSRQLVDDLIWDAANRSGDGRFPLPQGFRYSQPKAFPDRLLNNDGRSPLEGIDLQGAPGRQVKDNDIPIVAGGIHYLLENRGTLRIVGGPAASHYQLAVHILAGLLKGLGDDWARAIDSEFVANLLHKTVVEILVFLGERIYAGIEQVLGNL